MVSFFEIKLTKKDTLKAKQQQASLFFLNNFLHRSYDMTLKVNTNSIALKDDILTLSVIPQGLCKKLYQIIYVKFYSIFIFGTKNKSISKKLMIFIIHQHGCGTQTS